MATLIDVVIGKVEQFISSISLIDLVLGTGILISAYIILKIILLAFNKVLRKMAEKTKSTLDDLLINAAQKPLNILILLISVYLALDYIAPEFQVYGKSLNELFLMIGILWAAFVATQLLVAFINWYSLEMGKRAETKFGKQVFPFIKKTVLLAVYAVAALIVLDMIGVQIAPLLAGLGIAGLAIALALQESLSNFFAGIYILADKPVRLGDFIELEDGKSGYVEEIGWRSTRIRMLPNNTLIIPNTKLAQSTIINYYLPEKKSGVILKVGVDYNTDIEKAERILVESARKVLKEVKGGVKDFEPFVRLNNFGDYALELSLIVQVEEISDQYLVGHELRKEILKNFKKNKITIPFPTRIVYNA